VVSDGEEVAESSTWARRSSETIGR